MPPGTPFNGFILPYPIRVDDFTQTFDAKLHLLTHTHSDHLQGLQSKSFSQKVYCSEDTKQLVLRIEEFQERNLRDKRLRAEPIRKYKHLKVDPIYDSTGKIVTNGHQARDLLTTLHLNSPTQIEYAEGDGVRITAIDANHCPGSVMYLVQGTQGSILHTGDFRAEPWLLESIKRNPFLQPYLASGYGDSPSPSEIVKTLEAIYLDTACVMRTHSVPTKDSATSGLIRLMKLYPFTTLFFINVWTQGYEDILKAIARAFNSKIHLDRYKASLYTHINDPSLKNLYTSDPESTRFHACERFSRCHVVNVDLDGEKHPRGPPFPNRTRDGRRVVYVNPISSMTPDLWEEYQSHTEVKLTCIESEVRDEEVSSLLVPLSRHSPLPELLSFVRLFRPKRIIPNTLDPKLGGLGWVGIEKAFESAGCLAVAVPNSSSSASISGERGSAYDADADSMKDPRPLIPPPPQFDPSTAEKTLLSLISSSPSSEQEEREDDDVEIKNLVDSSIVSTTSFSQDTRETARRWCASVGCPSEIEGGSGSGNGVLGKGKGRQPRTRKVGGNMARKAALVMEWLGLGHDSESGPAEEASPSSPLKRESKRANDATDADTDGEGLPPSFPPRRRNISSDIEYDYYDHDNDSQDRDDDVHIRLHHQIFGCGSGGLRRSSSGISVWSDADVSIKGEGAGEGEPLRLVMDVGVGVSTEAGEVPATPMRPKVGEGRGGELTTLIHKTPKGFEHHNNMLVTPNTQTQNRGHLQRGVKRQRGSSRPRSRTVSESDAKRPGKKLSVTPPGSSKFKESGREIGAVVRRKGKGKEKEKVVIDLTVDSETEADSDSEEGHGKGKGKDELRLQMPRTPRMQTPTRMKGKAKLGAFMVERRSPSSLSPFKTSQNLNLIHQWDGDRFRSQGSDLVQFEEGEASTGKGKGKANHEKKNSFDVDDLPLGLNFFPSSSSPSLSRLPLKHNATEVLPVSFFMDSSSDNSVSPTQTPLLPSPLKLYVTCPDFSPLRSRSSPNSSASPRRSDTGGTGGNRAHKTPTSPTARLRRSHKRLSMVASIRASCPSVDLISPAYDQTYAELGERVKRDKFRVETRDEYKREKRKRWEAVPDHDRPPVMTSSAILGDGVGLGEQAEEGPDGDQDDPRMNMERRNELIERIRRDKDAKRRISLPTIGRDP
ncbi:hypothetical protein L218DRAFT_958303 [Marasmius fiardii PR-910]|nr:hypothetical protein L218DRAFT_958303 [Marasmius fiardii PR-910]